MISVSTKISEIFTMAVSEDNIADLEDGEIESGDEDCTEVQENNEMVNNDQIVQTLPNENVESEELYYSKSSKKKKSKSYSKSDQKQKDKSRKRKFPTPTEDDFAGNIEKAFRKVLNKGDEPEKQNQDDVEDRRKHKKRKKHEGKDSSSKKKRKREVREEVDESEMMCVRGASPVQKSESPEKEYEDDQESCTSETSNDSRSHKSRSQRHRHSRDRKSKSDRDRRRNTHSKQDTDGICPYYMQGKCHKGDDCAYSHDVQPPKKLELCKFYLMDCCAKRDKCLYMHSDFPCKYYHTGLPCIFKEDCKFSHGKPLSENIKLILLKHIESAPKEILGDFPRLSRDGAAMMIATTQKKLLQQYPSANSDASEKNIPSLFDLNIPKPQGIDDGLQHSNLSPNNMNYDKSTKVSPKVRQSRWQNEMNFANNTQSINPLATPNVLSIKNLTGVLTPRQILDLNKMGIENLDEMGQLTVLQLNSLGLTFKQINEIQLNTMSIQKLGLINSIDSQINVQQYTSMMPPKDMDLRVAPRIPVPNTTSLNVELPGQDIDMRFQPPVPVTDRINDKSVVSSLDPRLNKDMIDIDQYTKDALKFASKEKENIDISNDFIEADSGLPPRIVGEAKDVDQRVLHFAKNENCSLTRVDNSVLAKHTSDTDIRFLQPENFFRSPEKRNRRSTTDDDDDNNLLIDEKWYSSDDEKGATKPSPKHSPQASTPSLQMLPHEETASVLSKLGDLSKIQLSEEVTKLLNTMKNNLQEKSNDTDKTLNDSTKSRDPRNQLKKSPEHKMVDTVKLPTQKKSSRISIYDCVEGEPTDGRRRTDIDLRQTEFKLPGFGDTDLRHSSGGDIDFRLSLPFKAIPNYTPASEINGSINCHPPIPYKLLQIDIPRPDYTDIRNSTAKSQAILDPRLRRVFRLSLDDSNSDSEKSVKSIAVQRIDPRKKTKENNDSSSTEDKPSSLDLQTIIQNSEWYKDLSSTNKILVNQQLAVVTSSIKQYQQEKTPGKIFDLSPFQSNPILSSIFSNLGITLNEKAEFTYLSKPKEGLLKTPTNYNQNPVRFGINTNISSMPGIDGNNMNIMNVQPIGLPNIGPMNMGPMGPFNPFPDPRGPPPTPGLLGIAPNIPHNFESGFGGPVNFGNMPFSGPGNDFNIESEQNYPRFQKRGGFRGRGNDRWHRGSGGRGQRDRKNFNDHGNWKK